MSARYRQGRRRVDTRGGSLGGRMRFRRRAQAETSGDGGGTATAEEAGPVERPITELAPKDQREVGLIATQMATRGRDRDETEAYLRQVFQVSELDPLLDRIFGPR